MQSRKRSRTYRRARTIDSGSFLIGESSDRDSKTNLHDAIIRAQFSNVLIHPVVF
jgi:hypothetical protein